MTLSNRTLYDEWSSTYDTAENKTRDLESVACRSVLARIKFDNVIELGCGTGKNTAWLAANSRFVTAVDLSAGMQAAAKVRAANNVSFRIADIAGPWRFAAEPADLVTSSLVLEHIEDLGHVFRESAKHLRSGGHFYICELHPVKQYMGSKARFETGGEVKVLECFTHHFSDYIGAALSSGFVIADIDEWFDDGGRQGVPRLVSFLFRRP